MRAGTSPNKSDNPLPRNRASRRRRRMDGHASRRSGGVPQMRRRAGSILGTLTTWQDERALSSAHFLGWSSSPSCSWQWSRPGRPRRRLHGFRRPPWCCRRRRRVPPCRWLLLSRHRRRPRGTSRPRLPHPLPHRRAAAPARAPARARVSAGGAPQPAGGAPQPAGAARNLRIPGRSPRCWPASRTPGRGRRRASRCPSSRGRSGTERLAN